MIAQNVLCNGRGVPRARPGRAASAKLLPGAESVSNGTMLTRRDAQGGAERSVAWRGATLRRFADESPGKALLLGALLVGAFSTLWLVVQTPNFLSGYDFVRMHAFYKAYFRDALLAGRLPLWNPYVGLGRPFLADIETGTLYPPNLLVVPFGVNGGVAVLVLLHQALAAYGGVRLGRTLGATAGASWLVGAGMALASPFTSRLAAGMVPVYFSLCWWPALLWLGARLQDRWSARAAAGFAAAVAMAVLAGNPPILFVELLGLAVFLVLRVGRPAGAGRWRPVLGNHLGLIAAAVVGVGLSAAALLPFVGLVGQGNRPLNAPGFATANGMPAPSWLSLIVPASAEFTPNWEYDLHCGLVPLFAAVGGVLLWRDRNMRALLGLGLLGGILAAGDRAPFLGWVVHAVPGAAALRMPPRYGIWLAASLLGAGALALSRGPSRPLPLLLGLAVATACIAWLRPHVPAGPGGAAGYYASHVGALGAAALLVGLWQGRARWPRAAGLLGCALAVYCGANWLWAIRLQAPVYSAYGFRTDEEGVRVALGEKGLLTPGGAPPRISFNPEDLCENAGMAEGFSSFESYVNPALARVWDYLHVAAGVPLSTGEFIRLPRAIDRAPERLDGLNLVARLDHGSRSLVIRSNPDPRAYLAFDARVVPDWKAAEQAMAARRDFHETALLEEGGRPGFSPSPGRHESSAVIERFEPERIVVRTRADADAILVLGEAWYPGWRAAVAGAPAAVFPVNGWMRGVVVPAGEHEVVLTYRERALSAGLAISALCAALLALLAFRAPGPATGGPGHTDSRIL